VHVDYSLLTDIVGLLQKHPALYPLSCLPWALRRFKPDKIKAGIHAIGDVYVYGCTTLERCVKRTRSVRHSLRTETEGLSKRFS
jgi:hypothetical protein